MNGIIDKVAWIVISDGRVLGARSKGKDTYYFPGGKRESGETDVQTLIREVKEELSVDILSGTVTPFGIFEAAAHGKAEGVQVKMACFTADYTGELTPASEIAEIAWLAYEDRERVSAVSRMIFDQLHELKLLD
ncbi:NUDIX domain-containing protein [Paenibacillus sonchi]|uniref:NUDIX domain-containing protein n=1 Tax=Paenibacillus sonchi TaxID=373687 RepID=A0A974PI13_9BACL|nr:NUDIX domain-containing protein [Paenibacillus sonchi]MCE3200975.1 NUDIX domain-containing protein [Paenibacillus sonchi]QQZ64305.1 NUDIX domain-containing protein [Paenibacillus sonchi]